MILQKYENYVTYKSKFRHLVQRKINNHHAIDLGSTCVQKNET
jgi:hypothetical protein